jgi:hypothetical protein
LLEYCEAKDIDTTAVASMLSSSLKEKIRAEAEEMNLLKKLQSMDISESEKLKEVEKYQNDNYESKYLYKLEAGGLYNDWNFNID